jgi:hypothetical protein
MTVRGVLLGVNRIKEVDKTPLLPMKMMCKMARLLRMVVLCGIASFLIQRKLMSPELKTKIYCKTVKTISSSTSKNRCRRAKKLKI